MVKSCCLLMQESLEELLCHTFSRDYYKLFKLARSDIASAVQLLRLYRYTIKDGIKVLQKYLALSPESWIRKRLYDLDSVRVRLWWLMHLSPVLRSVNRRPDVGRHGHSISMVFAANLRGNRIAMTSMGLMANVSSAACDGDEIWIIYGCQTPFVLRRTERGHILVGECFVHGIMYGEAIEQDMGTESDLFLI